MNIKHKYLFFLMLYLLLNGANACYALDNTIITTDANNKAIITPPDENNPTTTIYDDDLVKLYSALGALHFLTNICFEKTPKWREKAQDLAKSERLNTIRQRNLFGAFNDAYYGFSTSYKSCTSSAIQAYNLHKTDAIAITTKLITQLGQNQD